MAEQLTPQQQTAVENRGGKLLVSAAAGSGKTKVLVDRLLRYLLDPVDPANLDEFLIITYTKAAAAELRSKIAEKLTQAISGDPSNIRLQKQMQRLSLTKISTVHAFCTDLLREYAYRLDIPADFRVADESECFELQMSVLDALMEELYSQDIDPDLQAFLETQGLGRDDRQIPELILQVYNSSRCHLDPDQWLDKCASGIDFKNVKDPADTPWGEYLIKDLQSFLQLHIRALNRCVQRLEGDAEAAMLSGLLQFTVLQLENLRKCDTWEQITKAKEIDFGRIPSTKKIGDQQLAERVKMVRDNSREQIRKKLELFADPADQVLNDLSATACAGRGLIDLVRKFAAAYDTVKRSRRVMDFSDLEQRTLDLLIGKNRKSPTSVANEISQRFREVMIDEYQDSNAVQDAIFSTLTDKNDNCFMVGDVKQSIYQFRLADPEIFLDKYKRFVPAENASYGQGRKVLLNRNFRSGEGVLSAANEVFSQCMNPLVGGLNYTEDEYLYPGFNHISLGEPEVELYAVDVQEDTYGEEASFVAQRITELLDGTHYVRNGDTLRPIVPDDIVILLRSPKTTGPEMVYALAERGIRCVMEGDIDLLQTEEVSSIWAMLQVIGNPLQDIPLLAVLMGRMFGFTADEIAQIRSQNRKCPVYEVLKESSNSKASYFFSVLEALRTEARTGTVTSVIDSILSLTRVDSIYAAMENGSVRLANIQAFCQMAADFEQKGNRDLDQFLQYLELVSENGLFIPGNQSSGAVSITSIHKSKGLEYPVVFLSGLSKRFNLEDTYNPVLCDRELGLGLCCVDRKNRIRYPSVAKKAIAQKMIAQSISEELRVLYVAMTRARDRLIMTYASDHLEKTLMNMVSRGDLCDRELMTSQVSSMGSWVLQTAMKKAEAGAFFALSGYPDNTFLSEYPWRIAVVSSPNDKGEGDSALEDTEELSEDIADRIGSSLGYVYPQKQATQTPSKITATQLKGRLLDGEVSQHTRSESYFRRQVRKPSFAVQQQLGKDRGNALHLAMQYIRYDRCTSAAAVSAEIERLKEEQFISAQQAELVDSGKIAAFFSTPIGKKLMTSENVLREFKISVLQDASDLPGEKILLQGVIDCALIESDGITVIDFKTDRVIDRDVERIVARYRPQVQAYGDAICRIYEKPVKEILLYLFDLDLAVTVS